MSRLHTQYLLFFVYLTLRCLRAATAYLIVNSHQGETCSDSVRWLICPSINLFVQRSSHTLVTRQRLCLLHRWLFHHTSCPAISSVFILLFITISPSASSPPLPVNLMFSHFLFPHLLHFFHHSPASSPTLSLNWSERVMEKKKKTILHSFCNPIPGYPAGLSFTHTLILPHTICVRRWLFYRKQHI